MIYYKPTQKPAVEITPAIKSKKEPLQLKKRYHINNDGTAVPVEEHLDWDFDKPNNPNE